MGVSVEQGCSRFEVKREVEVGGTMPCAELVGECESIVTMFTAGSDWGLEDDDLGIPEGFKDDGRGIRLRSSLLHAGRTKDCCCSSDDAH